MNKYNSKEVNAYFEQKPKSLHEIAVKISDIILSHQGMSAAIKWGKPTFTINNDFHHWICAIQVLKNKVSLIFHFGGLLSDEKNRLIAGSSKFLRKIEYDSLDSIDEEELWCFIQKAVEKLLYFKENWKEINKKD